MNVAADEAGTVTGMNSEDKQAWPDLAGRALGGSVIYTNDELFAERENLILEWDLGIPEEEDSVDGGS